MPFFSVKLVGLGTGNDALVLVGRIFLYEFTWRGGFCLSTNLLSSTANIVFFTIVRCETANRLSLEGLVVSLLATDFCMNSLRAKKLYFFVNGSAFFDCGHGICCDGKVRNCKSSEIGRMGGAFAASSKTRVFREKGILCFFFCRIGCFGYGK